MTAQTIDGGPPTGETKRGSRRALIWTLVVLGLVVLVGLIIGFAALAGDNAKQVAVPDVVGRPFTEAKTTLEDAGFEVKEEQVDDAADVGTVIRQDPAADERVDEGSEVTLTVSSGPGDVTVPDVVDLPFDEAKEQLEAEGFVVQSGNEPSGEVEADHVIRTDPGGGESAPSGSNVFVVVSSGEADVTIPDVSGDDRDAAFEELTEAGLVVREQSESSSSVPSDRVTRTDPPAGTAVGRGSTVRMFVSSGADTVEVPEVRGQSLAQAEQTLSDRGLTSSVIQRVDPDNVGKVVDQSPSAGARAQPGSNVVLTVAVASSSTTTSSTEP